MNPTLKIIENRRSIRDYDPTPLSQEEKDAILHAAMRAPTAGAMMLYTIIEVNDPEKKRRLAVTCDDQPFIARAPYLLLFLADYQRWMDLFEVAGCEARADELNVQKMLPGVGDLILAVSDALIAAQTAVIAAESLGIGSCYIGDIVENAEIHRELFNLPRYTFPAVLLCFGRSAKELKNPLRPRFERRFIVHQDSYRRFSPEELDEVHLPFGRASFAPHKYPGGAENIVQSIYFRKFLTSFSAEMDRSVQVWLKYWCGLEE